MIISYREDLYFIRNRWNHWSQYSFPLYRTVISLVLQINQTKMQLYTSFIFKIHIHFNHSSVQKYIDRFTPWFNSLEADSTLKSQPWKQYFTSIQLYYARWCQSNIFVYYLFKKGTLYWILTVNIYLKSKLNIFPTVEP